MSRKGRFPMVSARQLVGRTIVAFDPAPFKDGRGGVAYRPVISLDDGSRLVLLVEETEDPDPYGVKILKVKVRQDRDSR